MNAAINASKERLIYAEPPPLLRLSVLLCIIFLFEGLLTACILYVFARSYVAYALAYALISAFLLLVSRVRLRHLRTRPMLRIKANSLSYVGNNIPWHDIEDIDLLCVRNVTLLRIMLTGAGLRRCETGVAPMQRTNIRSMLKRYNGLLVFRASGIELSDLRSDLLELKNKQHPQTLEKQ